MLSILPPVQPSSLLIWVNYNYKSSKPNGSASPFERTEVFRYFWTESSQMAGPHTRCNAGGAPSNGNGISEPTPAVSCAPTPASASAPAPPGRYTYEDLQRATKLALKLFFKGQEHGQLQASSEAKDPIMWEEFEPIQTCLSASTNVSTGMGSTLRALTIDLVSIQPSRSPSQTHDA